MPQSLANILVHLVFSTKDRAPLIPSDIETELHAYSSQVFETCESPMIAIGGVEDHVHILFRLSRTKTMAQIVETIKTDTSRWIKTKGTAYARFHWQSGYGAFSVGPVDYEKVVRYIRSQRTHHQRKTFQEEYRELMRRSGQELDERYAWD